MSTSLSGWCSQFWTITLLITIMCGGPVLSYTREQLWDARPTQPQQLPSTTWDTLQNLRLSKFQRGCRAGTRKQRSIPVIHTSNRRSQEPPPKNPSNFLKQVPIHDPSRSKLTFCHFNSQSVCNKSGDILSYIYEKNIDICGITETFNPNQVSANAILPNGYDIRSAPRPNRTGGGVAILFREDIVVSKIQSGIKTSFEYIEGNFTYKSICLHIVVIYRPQCDGNKKKIPTSTFFSEFEELLNEQIQNTGKLILTGDFNFHLNKPSDPDARKFMSLLEDYDLLQHVKGPTHISGNTLDLIITRKADSLINNGSVYQDIYISDHMSVIGYLNVAKPPPPTKKLNFRKTKDIDILDFKTDLNNRLFPHPELDVSALVTHYNFVISEIMDLHAPINTKTINVRACPPWYTKQIKEARKLRKSLEKKWRRSKSAGDRAAYTQQKNSVNILMEQEKKDHWSTLITDAKGDQKKLFTIVRTLTGDSKSNPLPPHSSESDLANDFANFFSNKIHRIRSVLDLEEPAPLSVQLENTVCPHKFSGFSLVTEEEVSELIGKSPTKSCALDPLPTWLLKKCSGELVPVITQIINLSLSEGTFPENFKHALVIPLLKNLLLELILASYRPVSNLQYISKLTEKVVAIQFIQFCKDNNLLERLQSAYKEGHSIETALVRVHNDLLTAMDRRDCVLLILLDLSAAFDTLDHRLLLERLNTRCGVEGVALRWFESYLTNRSQSITINGTESVKQSLSYGVPQGSVLGPLLFTIYTAPLGDLLRQHGLDYHIYADDTKLYLSFPPSQDTADSAINDIEQCILDIRSWMKSNKLKLNDSKTEFIIVGTSAMQRKVSIPHIMVGDDKISPSNKVKDLGTQLDTHLTLVPHVSSVVKSVQFHLRNISHIRKYLTKDATQSLIHALVTSRLDCNNALLVNMPACQLNRLKLLQNTAARIITGTPRRNHITPILIELHWLPIAKRIDFKVLLLTFKCLMGKGPSYLKDLLVQYKPGRTLRSCNDPISLVMPKHIKQGMGERSFSFAAPQLWNKLPASLRACTDIDDFKCRLKTHLFKAAYFN